MCVFVCVCVCCVCVSVCVCCVCVCVVSVCYVYMCVLGSRIVMPHPYITVNLLFRVVNKFAKISFVMNSPKFFHVPHTAKHSRGKPLRLE